MLGLGHGCLALHQLCTSAEVTDCVNAGVNRTRTGQKPPPAAPPHNCTVVLLENYTQMAELLTSGWQTCGPACRGRLLTRACVVKLCLRSWSASG